ncbi:MAG: NAD(P)/FAD-dependent oxidoreductase [Pseudorhodoplanes sp.]
MADQCFVVAGGGQSGAWTIKTLRQQGYDGRLVLIGAERHPPYERPPLSKQLLAGDVEPESAYIFPARSYEDWGVDMRLGTRAVGLDPRDRRITLSDGDTLRYDRLLLATGGTPRRLNVPGAALEGIFYLRSIEDSLAVGRQLRSGGSIFIVGGGWIGLEVAATARKLGVAVTLAEYAPLLCGRAAPPDISCFLHELHAGHGVDIALNARIAAFEGAGRVERVRFEDGTLHEVSAVVVGIGIEPDVVLAAQVGLALDNGILVNSLWQTSLPEIFAAGDVASFVALSGRRTRLESWDNAQQQGIAAANGMLGKAVSPDPYPWFWSDQYDRNLQLIGDSNAYDEVITLGETGDRPRMFVFLSSGLVTGAAGIDAGRDVRAVKRLLQSERSVDAEMIRNAKLLLQKSAAA